jgi:hypothetical protein
MPCFSLDGERIGAARLGDAMSHIRAPSRLAVAALACVLAGGCSVFRQDPKPSTATATPAASAARAPVAMPAAAASAAGWGPVAVHLDPEAMVGQAWTFPSADPLLYRDIRFVFKRDRIEASNAREHAVGTWSVENDKLCVTLNLGSSGSACYYVTGTPPGDLQIRALPDGERVPLKIQ